MNDEKGEAYYHAVEKILAGAALLKK